MPQQNTPTTGPRDAAPATTPSAPPIGATVLGYPRIGRRRELKTALEAYWSGAADIHSLRQAGRAVRADAWAAMSAAGLDSIPVNTFSWYDQVLDAALMVGAVPARFDGVSGEDDLEGLDAVRTFALARGTDALAPLEMTKWFDTNYHYLVPEIGPDTVFAPHPAAVLAALREALATGGPTPRPVLVGPYTFLSLAKAADGAPDGFAPLDRLPDLVPVYAEVLAALREAGADWVQLDEPAAALDLDAGPRAALTSAYEELARTSARPALLVTLPFADPVEGLPALAGTGVEAIALDLVRGPQSPPSADVPGLADIHLVLGVVEGRNVWRTDLRAALDAVTAWAPRAGSVSIATSCSLLHVPYDVATETALEPALRADLAFADQKLAEVAVLQRGLTEGAGAVAPALVESEAAVDARAAIPGLRVAAVADRVAAIEPGDRIRIHRDARREAQAGLGLPPLPTTTIGSYPQTREVRRARADHRAGRIDDAAYTARMQEEITAVVRFQEEVGLDVLVHGEPERNDMVQYFAELLEGFATTAHGWVQSYGSRCVRPPILFGDVHRPAPMTVPWATFAQGLTPRPLKGMLTGPVTILAWSFVRTDQPRSVTADQVALALRDEAGDLEAAGIGIIQVDEPALRETLPLRRVEQAAYLDWSVGAFRLATAGVTPPTQVHTHLCYSEFGEIVAAIDGLDADVTSVEAARSRMELLADVAAHGFAGDIGPGVYDIHSPRVPDEAEIADLLTRALGQVPAERLWVNPDCGLKTRGYAEVEPALRALVGAARAARARLA